MLSTEHFEVFITTIYRKTCNINLEIKECSTIELINEFHIQEGSKLFMIFLVIKNRKLPEIKLFLYKKL